jgi:hypothetical protein
MSASLPFPFSEKHPRFRIPGWSALLGSQLGIGATEMARHFLITGETGSGKSASAVMRLLEGILRYPEDEPYRAYADEVGDKAEAQSDLKPAVLVVDPKQELADIAEREAHGRKVIRLAYGQNGPVLHLFEGQELGRLEVFEALDLILKQSDFYTQDMARTREPVWNMQAASILRDLMAIDVWLARRDKQMMVKLWDDTREGLTKIGSYGASYLENIRYNAGNYFMAHKTLISLCGEEDSTALAWYLDVADKLQVPGDMKTRLAALIGLAPNTRSSVIWMVNGILADLASEELAACVSVNPIEAPSERMLSVRDTLSNGDVVVYVPTASPIADMVGRCLKSKLFEFAFQRENKVRPFFYVVDEAHRFISAGEKDGEQSLLDRCRAYRTGVVLATQSLAALAYKLDASPLSGKNCLQIIVNNCGNALYFRTTDIHTQENVEQRIPGPPVPNRPHVVKVRPLSSLSVGQCYALRCDGTWGLFKVQLAA